MSTPDVDRISAPTQPVFRGLGRRRFLQSSAALASVSLLAGCSRLGGPPWVEKPMPKIGTLAVNNPLVADWMQVWEEHFAGLGHVDGQTVRIERKVAPGNAQLDELAAQLAASEVDVIMAAGWTATMAAKTATMATAGHRRQPIPIVSVTSDPVGSDPPLVDSFPRPGGNITGVTTMSVRLAQKRVEVIKDAIPGLQNTAIIWNAEIPDRAIELGETERAATSLGLKVLSLPVKSADDFEAAFATAAAHQTHAMFLLFDQMTFPGAASPPPGTSDPVSEPLAALMIQYRMPAVCDIMQWAESMGGLMTYGPDFHGLFRRAAEMVDKVMGGAKPADIPIEQPGRFFLTVNQRVAAAIGLEVPASTLKNADHIYQ
jgi:putative ABC transport system substrate-binding protein